MKVKEFVNIVKDITEIFLGFAFLFAISFMLYIIIPFVKITKELAVMWSNWF
ncbi:MAG: hypothetical protein U9P79_06015 [Candidatus Cloacimonadota bacterium]|nr:hypothetical protein [Candidatus Cloacimonadota bacterium]